MASNAPKLEKMNPAILLFQQQTYNLGVRPDINLDKAWALASEIEDEEISGQRPSGE